MYFVCDSGEDMRLSQDCSKQHLGGCAILHFDFCPGAVHIGVDWPGLAVLAGVGWCVF